MRARRWIARGLLLVLVLAVLAWLTVQRVKFNSGFLLMSAHPRAIVFLLMAVLLMFAIVAALAFIFLLIHWAFMEDERD